MKEEALRLAKFVIMPGRLPQGRTVELINDPAQVTQGAWGICGMTSLSYVLLRHRPVRFVEFVKQAVQGDSGGHLYKLLRFYDAKRNPEAVNMLDFLVSRYLGLLLERDNPTLFRQQVQFTRTLGQQMGSDGQDGVVLEQGDLALDKDGMLHLVRHVAGASGVRVLETGPRLTGEEECTQRLVQDHFDLAGAFIIAAQMEHDESKPYRFNHWAVLEAVKPGSRSGKVDVTYWSRGSTVTIAMTFDEVKESFPFLLLGRLD